MSATAHHRRGRSINTIEFAPSSGEYQLTELKNVSTSRSNSINTADFNIPLVRAVRDHPCFYDPNDRNFGSRHQDALYRSKIWQEISNNIGFTGGAKALMDQWSKLKERYIKERREGVTAAEGPLDDSLVAEMVWLDDYVLDGIPASSAPTAPTPDPRQMYFMEGDDDMLGDDFVDQHEYQEESRLEDERRRGGSPTGSTHSGGSDIDVGGVGGLPSSLPSSLSLKDLPGPSRGDNVVGIGNHGMMSGGGSRAVTLPRQSVSVGGHTPQTYRFVNAASSSQHHNSEAIPVSARSNGTLTAYPKREGSVVGGGSTLTMVIDPTTYYQNGAQKMYRLVNVADLDHSQHSLQHLRPAGMGGGGTAMIADPVGGIGFSIGRGTRKRMGAPLSPEPPMHNGGSGMMGGRSSSVDHNSLYGKAGQLGDELVLDDGIVGENTIVIDHQGEDDSPLLVDSSGMPHQQHLMGGGATQRGMHRGQHSPTLLGNGSGARNSGGYSPVLSNQGTSHAFNTTQYDADLALQHFISSHLARMNEDDKALAKMNIQRILLDARFGTGTTLRVCSCEEDAELAEAAIASNSISEE